jgi:hypothetical protein
MKNKKRIVAAAIVFIFLVAALSIGGLQGSTKALSAQLVVTNADIGIPGISKMYAARLVNRGFWAVRISHCDFVDDTLSPGKIVAYAVQRWDDAAKRWTTVVEASTSEFCKPYPLGIVKANVTSALLWPGQSLTTGEEATAARDAFHVGDRSRFVVFWGTAGDYSKAVTTAEFVIDEYPRTQVPLRVRH